MDAEYLYSFEVVQADDAPSLWYVCAKCYVAVRAEYFQSHWDWHKTFPNGGPRRVLDQSVPKPKRRKST
jgi:hypothetical protein